MPEEKAKPEKKWSVNINAQKSKDTIVTFPTTGKYIDRDIELTIPKISGVEDLKASIKEEYKGTNSEDIAIIKTDGYIGEDAKIKKGTLSGSEAATVSISSSRLTENVDDVVLTTDPQSEGVYYTLTAESEGIAEVTTDKKGWIEGGSSATVKGSKTYYIEKSVWALIQDGKKDDLIKEGKERFEVQPGTGYVKIPGGYFKDDRYVFADVADKLDEALPASNLNLSVNSISGGSEVSIGQLSKGFYPIIANNLSVTGTVTADTPGWFSSTTKEGILDEDAVNVTVGKIAPAVTESSFTSSELTTYFNKAEDNATTYSIAITPVHKTTTAGYEPKDSSEVAGETKKYNIKTGSITFNTFNLTPKSIDLSKGTDDLTTTGNEAINIGAEIGIGDLVDEESKMTSSTYPYFIEIKASQNKTTGQTPIKYQTTAGWQSETSETSAGSIDISGTSNTTYIPIKKATGTNTVTCTLNNSSSSFKPTINKAVVKEDGKDKDISNVKINEIVRKKPESGYYVAVKSEEDSTGITVIASAKAKTIKEEGAGYLQNDTDFATGKGSSTITLAESEVTYIPIQSAVNSGVVSYHKIEKPLYEYGVNITTENNKNENNNEIYSISGIHNSSDYRPSETTVPYICISPTTKLTEGKSVAKAKGEITTEGYIVVGSESVESSGKSDIESIPISCTATEGSKYYIEIYAGKYNVK